MIVPFLPLTSYFPTVLIVGEVADLVSLLSSSEIDFLNRLDKSTNFTWENDNLKKKLFE